MSENPVVEHDVVVDMSVVEHDVVVDMSVVEVDVVVLPPEPVTVGPRRR
jgi:hypothetical protein